MRPQLTKEIFENSRMVTSKGSISLIDEMNQCKQDGWEYSFYCDYLSQFFDEDSIHDIVKWYWDNPLPLEQYFKELDEMNIVYSETLVEAYKQYLIDYNNFHNK